MTQRRPLAEWLREAHAARAADCPPPEAFHRLAIDDLPEEEAAALLRHAASCPHCDAERQLALAFTLATAAQERDTVSAVVGALRQRAGRGAAATDAAAVRRSSPRWTGRIRAAIERGAGAVPPWALAVAAMLVIVVGLFAERGRQAPPPLPEAGRTPARSLVLEALGPLGDVAGPPEELRWSRVDGANEYAARVEAVDGASLWETKTAATQARLPAPVRRLLQPSVTYVWWVRALDASGAVLATSGRQQFRLLP